MKTRATLYALLLLLATTTPAYAQTSGPPPSYPFFAALFGALAIHPFHYLLSHYRNPRQGQTRYSRSFPAYLALALFTLSYLAAFIAPAMLWNAFKRIGGPYEWHETRTILYVTYIIILGPALACQFAHWALSAQKDMFRSWLHSGGRLTQILMTIPYLIVAGILWLLYFLPFFFFDHSVRALSIYQVPDPTILYATGMYSSIHPGFSSLLESLFCLLIMLGILALHPVRYLRAYRHEIPASRAQSYLAMASYVWLAFLGVGYCRMFLRVLLVYRVFD